MKVLSVCFGSRAINPDNRPALRTAMLSVLALAACLYPSSAHSSPDPTFATPYEFYDVGVLSRVEPDSCWLFVPSFGRSGMARYRLENVGQFGEGDTVVVTGGIFEFETTSGCGDATTFLHGNAIQSDAEFDFGCGVLTGGQECRLFISERYGIFECPDWSGHQAGESLRLVGGFVHQVYTTCMMGPVVRGMFDATCPSPTIGLSWGRLKSLY